MNIALLAAAMSFALVSCSKGESSPGGGGGDTPSVDEKIELNDPSQSSIVFSEEASSNTVSFTSSGSWTAALSDDRASGWCSVSPSSGSAGTGASVTITVTQNSETEDRTATVVLTCGSKKVLVSVTQKQGNSLTITKSKFDLTSQSDTVRVEVKAGITPTFTIDETCRSWISSIETKSVSTTVFSFFVKENEGDRREGKILITSGSLSETVTVYQAEGNTPTIVVSQSEIPITYESCNVQIDVRHNVGVKMQITSGGDWLSEVATKAFSTTSYFFAANRNDSGDPRTAKVTFSNDECGLCETVTIIQMQKDAIVVAKSSYTVAQEGETIKIELTHNVDYTVKIEGDWIKKKEPESKAMVTDDLYFEVAANDSYDGRSGSITFTAATDSSITQKVMVFQNQRDAIVLGETTTTTGYESGTFSVTVKTNVDVTVSIPSEATWIHRVEDTKGGLVENTFSFLVDENVGGNERKAELTFSNFQAGITQKYLVLQGTKPTVVVGDIYNITYKGGTMDITISSNLGTYDVEVESSASSWLSFIQTKSMRTDILTFAAAENSMYETRTANVSIKDVAGTVVKSFYIKQNAKPIPCYEIWYSTKAGYTMLNVPTSGWGTGVTLRENLQQENHCVLRFDGDVTSIPSGAFKNQTPLISMTLPESVTSIGNYAFSGCTSMSDITIPSMVSSVGTGAFTGFAGTAYINSSKLPASTFAGTDIVCASFGEEVTGIAEKAFYNCQKLAYVTFPNTLTSIGDYAFAKCNFTSAVLPSSLRTLGKGVFSDCLSLKSVSMTDTLTTMGAETFSGCTALETLVLPSVSAIPEKMCYDCAALPSISIPNRVKSIGPYAFSGCKSLVSITLPSVCTSIGNYAFSNCTALTTITCESKKAVSLGKSPFNGAKNLSKLYVPEGSEGAYHDIWGGTVKYINGIYTNFLSVGSYECKADSTGVLLIAGATIDSTGCPYSVFEGGISFSKSYSRSSAVKKEPWAGESYTCEKVCVPDKNGYIYWRPYVTINGGIWQTYFYEIVYVVIPHGIYLNSNTVLAIPGESVRLVATVEPEKALTGDVKWSSSNESVAKVSENGTVTCLSKGEAIITYKIQYKGMSASCRVTVIDGQEGDNEGTEDIDLDL